MRISEAVWEGGVNFLLTCVIYYLPTMLAFEGCKMKGARLLALAILLFHPIILYRILIV